MTDASVKVGVDTSEGVKELKKLKRAAEEAKHELSSFDKIVGAAFGTKNVFQVTNFNRALTSLSETAQTFSHVLIAANIAVVGFFAAIVKELNKLQGFLSIMTLSTKSVEEAEAQFQFLRKTANDLGIDLNALTANYAKLVAAVPDGNEKFQIAQRVFMGVAMAARTLHASTLDTQLMFYAVTQMASKGVISMEELRRQLGERLPGAMEIAARSLNTTTQELEKAIRTGAVQSIPFLKYFGDELIRTFAGSAEIASNTVDAAFNRLKNVWVDFVKTVLDSGAGKEIVRVFDELRNKLSDPYVMATFAGIVEDIASKVADFVKNLTAEDIRNAFSALRGAVQLVVDVTLKLIGAMEWIINNSRAVGAVIGGLVGAAKGAAIGTMFGGPYGALIGAGVGGAAGALGGYAAGSSLAPSAADRYAQQTTDARVNAQIAEQQRQTAVMLQSVMGSLSALGFSNADMGSILPLIEKKLGFNVNSAQQFAEILKSDKFKNLQERQAAALMLAQYGQLLGPRGSLEDVLGTPEGKGKKPKREPRLTKKDDLKEGLQYIEMLERTLAKEEQLTEVEKIWRALQEGRLAFNSEENFLRAMAVAKKVDETRATEALTNATINLNKAQREAIDRIQDDVTKGLMNPDEQRKAIALREFDQKVNDQLAKETLPEVKAQIQEVAEVLREDLNTELDNAIALMNSWQYGLAGAMKTYVYEVTNGAKVAASQFNAIVNSMETTFANFIKTGKMDFRSLADTIINEMIRVVAQQSIAQIFSFILPNVLPSGVSLGSSTSLSGGSGWTGKQSVPPSGQVSKTSAPVNVNVINNAGVEVKTTATQDNDGVTTLDVILEAVEGRLSSNVVNNRGTLAGALQSRFALRSAVR